MLVELALEDLRMLGRALTDYRHNQHGLEGIDECDKAAELGCRLYRYRGEILARMREGSE